MNKNKKYYIFWSSIVLIFVMVMASTTIGLQYWLANQTNACPIPEPTVITVEEIPITLETHEAEWPEHRPKKWIDNENQVIHYIYPDGSGNMLPMYATVPPVWYQNMLEAYRSVHGDTMPPEIAEAIPWEWKQAVMPGSVKPLPKGGNPN